MNRGDVFDACMDPVEGSEPGGQRPVVIVSRNAINASSPVVVVVPVATLRAGRYLYPSQVVLRAPDGGLTGDSVALTEQIRAIDRARLKRRRGALSAPALESLDRALAVTLDMPHA